MWIVGLSSDERALIESLREYAPRFEIAAKVIDLKKQLADLEIEKGKMKEHHDKEERELRHMIGLEKKRQEFEIDQAKRETSLKVREENLTADKKRFEDQMKFHEQRFSEEVKYLKDLMKEVLERLPNVTATFEGGRKK